MDCVMKQSLRSGGAPGRLSVHDRSDFDTGDATGCSVASEHACSDVRSRTAAFVDERGSVFAEMAIATCILVVTILGAVRFAETMILFRSDRAQYLYRSAVLVEPCSRPNDYKPSACS